MSKKAKLFLLGILVLVLGVFLYISQVKSSNGIKIDTSPKDSVITINGKNYKPGYIELDRGTYTIDVSHPAFKPQQRTISISETGNEDMFIILSPDGENGRLWLERNPKEVARRELVGSKVISDLSEKQVEDLPIIKQLPHVDNFYRIDYGNSEKYPKDSTKTALYVRYYSQDGITEANDWLMFNGVDLEKTEIIYIDAVAEQE